jgi:hypothetical protein
MATGTVYLAIRSAGSTTETTDNDVVHYFDVSCAKCREMYGVWGPGPDLEENLRQDQEQWLSEHLQSVCPYHRDSFALPVLEPE